MIRWLVVGGGKAGQVHLAAIAQCSDAVVCGLVSRHAEAPPGVTLYTDLDEALATSGCDAVVVATATHTHAEICKRAIVFGIPVLCEKPVGLNQDDARSVARASHATGVPVGVVLNQRFCRHNQHVKALVDSGDLVPRSVLFSASFPRLTGWLADPELAGGGVLRTIGVHYLDLMRWWFGDPHELTARLAGEPVEDRVAVSARFGDEVIGSMYFNATVAKPRGPVSCIIDGEGGRITLSGHQIVEIEGLPEPPELEPADPAMWFGPGHRAVIEQSTAALRAGDPFPVTLRDALSSLEMVDLAYARG